MFYGHITIGKLLIDHKADKMLKDSIGLNFVQYAINGGHYNAIRFALDHADDDVLHEQNQCGWNILISASKMHVVLCICNGNPNFSLLVFMRCHVKIIKLLWGYDDRIKTSSEQREEGLRLADITNQSETLAFLQSAFKSSAIYDLVSDEPNRLKSTMTVTS